MFYQRELSRSIAARGTSGTVAVLFLIGAGMLVVMMGAVIYGLDASPVGLSGRTMAAATEAAAYGAASRLPDVAQARRTAHEVFEANLATSAMSPRDMSCDIDVYAPHSKTPFPAPFSKMGPNSITLQLRATARSLSSRYIPLPGWVETVHAEQKIIWGPANSAPVDPIYIRMPEALCLHKRYRLPFVTGDDKKIESGFGWLQLPGERPGDQKHLLRKLAGRSSVLFAPERLGVTVGDTVAARSPDQPGEWIQAMVGTAESSGRLLLARQSPYSEQTITEHSSHHPRLIVAPVVEVVDDGFRVQQLTALWLEDVSICDGEISFIVVRPVQHTCSHGSVAPDACGGTLYAQQLLD